MGRDDFGLGHDQEGGASQAVIIKSRYQAAADPDATQHLRCALYYMQMRETGEREGAGPRALFTATAGDVARKDARRALTAHTDVRVLFHREIMSPAAVHELRSVEDVQEWTRGVLSRLEERLQMRLVWAGTVHRNTDHPHAHVLISGSGERLSGPKAGQRGTVRLNRSDLDALRAYGYEVGERMAAQARERRRADVWRELDAMAAAGAARQARDREQRRHDEEEEARSREHHQSILGRIAGRLGGRRGARGDAPGAA